MPLRQSELDLARLAVVVLALTDTLPKKSCRGDWPGCAGKTIGSSGAEWLTSHFTEKTASAWRRALARSGRPTATTATAKPSRPRASAEERRRRRRFGAGRSARA